MEVTHLSRLFSRVSRGIVFFDLDIFSTIFLKLRFLLVKLIFIPSFPFVMVLLFFLNTLMLLVLFLFPLKALLGLLLSQWEVKGGLAEKLTITSGYQVASLLICNTFSVFLHCQAGFFVDTVSHKYLSFYEIISCY